MSIGMLLMIVLLFLLIGGAFPSWPHSRSWGYAPSGFFSVIFIVLIVLLLTGRL